VDPNLCPRIRLHNQIHPSHGHLRSGMRQGAGSLRSPCLYRPGERIPSGVTQIELPIDGIWPGSGDERPLMLAGGAAAPRSGALKYAAPGNPSPPSWANYRRAFLYWLRGASVWGPRALAVTRGSSPRLPMRFGSRDLTIELGDPVQEPGAGVHQGPPVHFGATTEHPQPSAKTPACS
jgi:hypothetical protein